MGRTHTVPLRVRYSECDLQGHVFNANYFSYFDIALTELWRVAAGGYEAMLESGVDLVVAETTARYRAPARFDDELVLEITVAHLGTTSMRTDLRVLRDGVPLVEGQMVHVFIERATTAKTPIPPAIRAGLEGPASEGAGLEGPAAEGPAAEGPAAEGLAAEGLAGPTAEGPTAEGDPARQVNAAANVAPSTTTPTTSQVT
jgi:acyl-CoA thioester hydrolase